MNVEFTTVCRISDPATGRILAHRRVKSWKGVTFPGGHVEDGESAVEAIRREVREETGLLIGNIAYTGLIHWIEPDGGRTLIMVFCADWKDGELIEVCDEGRNFWVDPEEFETLDLSPHFREQLPAFERGRFRECFYANTGAPIITP
jgi:8-oxo-dGTP diphosphatase